MSPEALRRSLLEMLTQQLIPLATRAEQAPLILMEPLSLLRSGREQTLHPGKALPEDAHKRSRLYLNRWESAGVQSIRYPYLAAVIEGEIDWRIGITQSVVKQDGSAKDCDYIIIPVRQDTFSSCRRELLIRMERDFIGSGRNRRKSRRLFSRC